MKYLGWSIAVGLSALILVIALVSQSGILTDTKRDLRRTGAKVRTLGIMGGQDCKNSTEDLCNNFPNTDVIYQGALVPCGGPCNDNNEQPIPFVRNSLTWQLDKNEAVMLFGPIPPSDTHYSVQVTAYDRGESNIPDAAGYVPPAPGEVIPAPGMAGRRVVDASIGDSFNNHVLNFSASPDDPSEEIYAFIMTGNQIVADHISATLIENGLPSEAINVLGLPDSFVFAANENADTFRLVIRIARPFDESAVDDYLKLTTLDVWRISLDLDAAEFLPYPEVVHRDRRTGRGELDGSAAQAFEQFKEWVIDEQGQPQQIIQATARSYDDELCIATGSYCWGNTNDALYIDINDPQTNALASFSLEDTASKIVIVGLDHQRLGYADFWNFGYFDPSSGANLGSVNFAEIQQSESYPPLGHALDGSMFYLQLKANCVHTDKHCYEVGFGAGAAKQFSLMNRIYVNPQTATGPAASEVALPVIYVYE